MLTTARLHRKCAIKQPLQIPSHLKDVATILVTYYFITFQQVQTVLWTQKGVRTTVATAGHCTHTAQISGHALARCGPKIAPTESTPMAVHTREENATMGEG